MAVILFPGLQPRNFTSSFIHQPQYGNLCNAETVRSV